MWASKKGYDMEKIYRIINNITTLFVFVMTFVVSFILSLAQNDNMDLDGEKLAIFLLGFLGSIICVIIRYVILYNKAISHNDTIKKIFIIIYLIVGNILFVLVLIGTIVLSNFSIKYDALSNYNACQIFMLVILLSQWIGEKIIGE